MLPDYSALHNSTEIDDDYDFALELRPDDAYRQAAETMESIIDFGSLDLETYTSSQSRDISEDDLEKGLNRSFKRFSSVFNVHAENKSTFDNRMSNLHLAHLNDDVSKNDAESSRFSRSMSRPNIFSTVEDRSDIRESNGDNLSLGQTAADAGLLGSSDTMDSSSTSLSVISKREFTFGLSLLEKHKKWAEKAARKSSLGVNQRRNWTEKEAIDQFLVLLAGGVYVRRHQNRKFCEIVRLFSTTGGKLIQWEKPSREDLLAQCKGKSENAVPVPLRGSRLTLMFDRKTIQKDTFDCCIAICGCCDETLLEENRIRSKQLTDGGSGAQPDDPIISVDLQNCCFNIGFKRNGTLKDLDIIDVHPASKEDPTQPGMLGTESLRGSRDAFNQQLTFSVVSRDVASPQGFSTLDVECDNEDAYCILLQGFRILLDLAEQHKKSKMEGGGEGDKDSSRRRGRRKRRNRKKLDPISQLFQPSNKLDPLRALKVGGGLLPTGHGLTSMTKTTGASFLAALSPIKGAVESMPSSMKTIPGQDLPPAQFLGWSSAGTQIWARLKLAGLDVKCVFSWDLRRVILKLRCPQWRLEEMAEQMRLKVKTKNGYMKKFKVSRRDTFIPFGGDGSLFRSSERQQIIDYIVRSKIKDGGAELDESSELGKHIVQAFPLHMYSRLDAIRHSWVTFWKREKPGEIAKPWSPFSQPYYSTYMKLKDACGYVFSNIFTQPLDAVAEYFGEGIAFYFAYMVFYTRWLAVPSILGLVVFCFQMSGKDLDHWLLIPFSVFIIFWVCFMLVFWRQKSSYLAHRWGVLDFEAEETDRPQFRGKYVYNESTGEIRKMYSLWKRMGKYVVSIPVMILSIFAVLVVMTAVFASQGKLLREYRAGEPLNFTPTLTLSSTRKLFVFDSYNENVRYIRKLSVSELRNSNYLLVAFFYPCLYGMLISLMTLIFQFIAQWLNNFENHRTQNRYLNRLILKVFSFEFVTVFTSLYYYAFSSESKEVGYFQISVTIFSLMTVGQWWSVLLNIFLPSVYQRALLYSMRANLSHTNRLIYQARSYLDRHRLPNNEINSAISAKLEKRIRLLEEAKSKCWEEALLSKYDTFNDYTNAVIQIAFLLCFSAVFPLSPLIAMINNILLIRVNAYKLCYTRQRPVSQKTGSMGVWVDVLHIMSICGVLTNCAILGLTSTQLRDNLGPTIGGSGIAIVLFIYEQGVLFFSYWLHKTVPKIPLSVQNAKARERKSLENSDTLLLNASLSRKASSMRILRETEDAQAGIAYRNSKNDSNSTSNSNSNDGHEAKWGDTIASLIPNGPGDRLLLGNKSRSMVIASRRAFAEQRSASDYTLLARTEREWATQKRVTFDSIPRFFAADTQKDPRNVPTVSEQQYSTMSTLNTMDPDNEVDNYPTQNDEYETFVEGDYISVSDEDEDDDDDDSDASSDGMHISPGLEQLGYMYSPKTNVPPMNPWDMRFSPEDMRQSEGSVAAVAQQNPSPPSVVVATGGQPLTPMVRGNSSKVSSLQRCDSPKNYAIQKLEEVLESLKQQQDDPPLAGNIQQNTAPVVAAAVASSSPARKAWFFRNNNKGEGKDNPSPVPPSRSHMTPNIFMGGSATKSKKKPNNILDSIAPLGQQLAGSSPSHSILKQDSEVKYQSQKQVLSQKAYKMTADSRAPPARTASPSGASEPKKGRQVPKESPKKPRYHSPAVPEFANASMDISMYNDDSMSKRYRGSSSGTPGPVPARVGNGKGGKITAARNSAAFFQSFRQSDADEKIIRWTQKLTKAKNNLLRAMDRAQSPFFYVMEHKEQSQSHNPPPAPPPPSITTTQSKQRGMIASPPNYSQPLRQQQKPQQKQKQQQQQHTALPRKLSNSPADLSDRRPNRAQELPRSALKQHRPPAPQSSGPQSSYVDHRHASPNSHQHNHQVSNSAQGEQKTGKKRNEVTGRSKTPDEGNPFAFANT